jgi:hypothetical protein
MQPTARETEATERETVFEKEYRGIIDKLS